MDIEKVHPELRKVIRRFPKLPLHRTWVRKLVNIVPRLLPKAKVPEGVKLSVVDLGDCSLRVYEPESGGSGAGLLWIHGGGMVIGFAAMNDVDCFNYVTKLGLVVVSVEYRLAPKYPYPAAIDDCYEGWLWLQDNAGRLGVDPYRIAVSGQSAGALLAAALVQRAVDDGRIQPAAQALFCPMLDDRTSMRRELDEVEHWVWNNSNNEFGWRSHLGPYYGADKMPDYAVPARRESLAGMPPTWIGVGDIDLFYEEDRVYAERLQAAGIDCEFDVVAMAPHAFESAAPSLSFVKEFMAKHYLFLRKHLQIAS